MSPGRRLRAGGRTAEVVLRPLGEGRAEVAVDGRTYAVALRRGPGGSLLLDLEGRLLACHVVRSGRSLQVRMEGRTWLVEEDRPRGASLAPGAGGADAVEAPMTGTVLAVLAEQGTRVRAGDPLVLLSAMKMEHRLCAPCDAEVAEVRAAAGAAVQAGEVLLRLAPAILDGSGPSASPP